MRRSGGDVTTSPPGWYPIWEPQLEGDYIPIASLVRAAPEAGRQVDWHRLHAEVRPRRDVGQGGELARQVTLLREIFSSTATWTVTSRSPPGLPR
jgi:hypothetical protein